VMQRYGCVTLVVGLLLLIHSAYSAIQHRTFLKLSEQAYESLPNDIGAESILAVVLCSVGVVLWKGKFKPIHKAAEMAKKTFDMVNSRPDFYIFNHRGRSLSRHLY